MKNGVVVLLCTSMVAAASACQKKADNESVSADTTAITGRDTVNGQSVTTMDTIVRTTTTKVDTIEGDTAKKDTTRH